MSAGQRSTQSRDDVYTDDRGRLRCREHGKAAYHTEDEAECAVVAMARKGTTDPGLESYACLDSGTFHIGHPNRWRSLGRLVEEAGGDGHVSR